MAFKEDTEDLYKLLICLKSHMEFWITVFVMFLISSKLSLNSHFYFVHNYLFLLAAPKGIIVKATPHII